MMGCLKRKKTKNKTTHGGIGEQTKKTKKQQYTSRKKTKKTKTQQLNPLWVGIGRRTQKNKKQKKHVEIRT